MHVMSLVFGLTRNMMRCALESAMVVVYERELGMAPSDAALLASLCCFSSVLAAIAYRETRRMLGGKIPYDRVLLVAEGCALLSSLLFIATGAFVS